VNISLDKSLNNDFKKVKIGSYVDFNKANTLICFKSSKMDVT
jgi:hypothetical protein